MNPIKVIKNVSGQTYGELESSLAAIDINIKATTLAHRYKSTSAHSKLGVDEMKKLSLALTSENPPEGAKDLIDAFAETVYVINELLGTDIMSVGGGKSDNDILSDEDFDDLDVEEDDDLDVEEDDSEELDDWNFDDDDDDDWGLDESNDDEWDFEELDEEVEEVKNDNDDLMDLIFDDDIPEVPESDDENIFSVLEDDSEPLPSTPENFENQSWLDDGDEFDSDNARI